MEASSRAPSRAPSRTPPHYLYGFIHAIMEACNYFAFDKYRELHTVEELLRETLVDFKLPDDFRTNTEECRAQLETNGVMLNMTEEFGDIFFECLLTTALFEHTRPKTERARLTTEYLGILYKRKVAYLSLKEYIEAGKPQYNERRQLPTIVEETEGIAGGGAGGRVEERAAAAANS